METEINIGLTEFFQEGMRLSMADLVEDYHLRRITAEQYLHGFDVINDKMKRLRKLPVDADPEIVLAVAFEGVDPDE